MKKLLLLVIFSILISACVSPKHIEKKVSSGNYDKAITSTLKKLKTNKQKKNKAEYIYLLKDAYLKAVSKNTQQISYLKQNNNPANYEAIYKLYLILDKRQESIKPVLPLYLDGEEVTFNFKNYNTQIFKAKENLSSYLYKNANTLLNSNSKINYRNAFDNLKYIDRINPNYKNVNQLIKLAREKGTDYVIIAIVNNTQQFISQQLREDLLNFNTHGLNTPWTVYHSYPNPTKNYSFAVDLILKNIYVSPEKIKKRELIKEKRIKDGWKYSFDRNGNALKDSLGKKIKVDKFKMIRCKYFETKQFKTSNITGIVEFINLESQQLIKSFPINSEYLFKNIYARSKGDRRALNQNLINNLNNPKIQFPSDEQMIYNTGEDLKLQLKEIITSNNFR